MTKKVVIPAAAIGSMSLVLFTKMFISILRKCRRRGFEAGERYSCNNVEEMKNRFSEILRTTNDINEAKKKFEEYLKCYSNGSNHHENRTCNCNP